MLKFNTNTTIVIDLNIKRNRNIAFILRHPTIIFIRVMLRNVFRSKRANNNFNISADGIITVLFCYNTKKVACSN